MPKLANQFLESKHADIKATRDDDFHYAWQIGENQLLSVEYIPNNWPCLTVCIDNSTVEGMTKTLAEIGFEIQE